MRWHFLPMLALLAVGCQQSPPQQATEAANPPPPPGPAPGTAEWKIQDALSAAPAAIAANAAVLDWPAEEGGEMPQLKAGTNGWTCLPDMPDTPADDPMCLDGPWMQWAAAWMGHTEPELTSVGISYMLQGGADASNTDPYATEPDSTTGWIMSPAHVMVIVPDRSQLDGLPTDPNSGGPYVMWKGTPYAHIMVPVK